MKSRRRCGVTPMADQNRGVDRTQARSLVVSRRGVETDLPWNTVVAADDVVKNRCSARSLLAGQRIEHDVGISLPGRCILHDQSHQPRK
jgi:hypothetical protein